MNFANKITISRIFIMPIFAISLEMQGFFWGILSLICFLYATFSDWLDGYLARKNNLVSDFGKFIDPLADKIFVCAAFISFVKNPKLHISAWMVTLIVARELLITGLRTLAVSKGVVLAAQKSGKYKTAFQLIGIFLIILVSFIYDLEYSSKFILKQNITNIVRLIPIYVTWFLVIFTTYSGVDYLYNNRKLIN
ncbi:MAG: CDP-diacylglycerol--glycerol-3-phosphate 3-phosphatidyltransferase [Elusimicrobiota bacterium]|jgi:CDP-diacylglycerol--glycerol-3-phosphate 3-phosphatidyltransferase|nr:CDP-diacylglycerol--glycerol-3-phosphate 3-phosphatidyltransferase [Elusimicrobiota bacterium]